MIAVINHTTGAVDDSDNFLIPRLIVTITCEQCLAVYRKPLAELCQRGMRNLHLSVRHQILVQK